MKRTTESATSSRNRVQLPRRVVRGAALALAVIAAATPFGCAASRPIASSDAPKAPREFAGRVDIGGRRIYMECRGTGSPTVVLLSGLDTAADLWDAPEQSGPRVLPEVARTTRVCAYDRPGAPTTTGQPSRSDDVPQPSTPGGAVDDLHALLQKANVPGPYVFAAHSYSGLIVRMFAGTYPDEVAGIVFVDVVSPELRALMSPKWWEHWKAANARSESALAEYPALERIEFDQALDQAAAAPPLRPMPVIVLSADERYGRKMDEQGARGELPAGVPSEIGYVIDSANAEAQEQLAQLVPGARHLTDTHSGHNMMIDNPTLVVDAIVDVVGAVREHRTALTAVAPSPTTTATANGENGAR